MPLHYRHGFHSRLADLNKLLRYFLGSTVVTLYDHRQNKFLYKSDLYRVSIITKAKYFYFALHVAMQDGLYILPFQEGWFVVSEKIKLL